LRFRAQSLDAAWLIYTFYLLFNKLKSGLMITVFVRLNSKSSTDAERVFNGLLA